MASSTAKKLEILNQEYEVLLKQYEESMQNPSYLEYKEKFFSLDYQCREIYAQKTQAQQDLQTRLQERRSNKDPELESEIKQLQTTIQKLEADHAKLDNEATYAEEMFQRCENPRNDMKLKLEEVEKKMKELTSK
jgi:uncharacterized small protein (DUF1192 family)